MPPRLALVSRGDPLTPYLFAALRERFPISGELSPDLTSWQRAFVGAGTFRTDREKWAQHFIKSPLGFRLRSRNTVRRLARLTQPYDLVFQVHGLSGAPAGRRSVIYVDCTHQQSAEQWTPWNPLSGSALKSWLQAEGETYREAAHLFSFSEETRETLEGYYGVDPDRITVTGAGLDLTTFPAPAPRTGPPTILFVGHDFERKGGRQLLEAFRAVRSAVPDARLVLVGRRPELTRIPDGVEVLGPIEDRGRLARIYAGATVFTLPSLFEPYGLVVVEAMSFGLPVVATSTSGIRDIVRHGETGLLVPVGDPEALAHSLTTLLLDDTRAAAMGLAGRDLARSRFQWGQVVDRMAPALSQAATSIRSPA
jgi:glycosyltransferase involved in cell wall biosynthesis